MSTNDIFQCIILCFNRIFFKCNFSCILILVGVLLKIQIMLKSHLISVSDSHCCECLILHASLEHKLHKKDKVEEIVGGIEICQGTNKAGIDFSLSSNWCPSSLQRKTTPPSPSREAQKTQQLSSRCSPILVSNSQLPQLRMGSGRLTLCWCLR